MINLTLLRSKVKFIILGAAVILIIIAAIIISTFGKKDATPRNQTSTSTEPNAIAPPQTKSENLSEDIKVVRKKIIDSQIANRNGDIILYESENYQIEYIPTPDVFFVRIFRDPASIYKKEAQEWFLKFGLKQQELCSLPVRFLLTSFELRKSNSSFTSLPDNCDAPTLKKSK